MAPVTLYVGNLDSRVTNKELYNHLKDHAPRCHVNFCIIVEDSQTEQSLGYAFVEYYNHDKAAEVMKLVDSTLLMNKPIQVLFSPFHHDLSPCVVFIKNLPRSITQKALFRELRIYGNIISINIATDASGYATVRYDCVEAAQTAISHLNGRIFQNKRKLHVSSFLMVALYGFHERAYNKISLSIPGNIFEKHLRDILSPFGDVISVRIKEFLPKGERYAAVTFENSKVADRAADALKSHPLLGYLGRVPEDTSTFRALAEMDAKMIISKKLHLNLFQGPEEDEEQKTETSLAQEHALAQALAQAQFFHSLTSPVGALPVKPIPLPVYSPHVMYPLTGPGFGQQTLYPEALPTQFPLQPGFGHQQQLFPSMWPYKTTCWGSDANYDFPDLQGKLPPYC